MESWGHVSGGSANVSIRPEQAGRQNSKRVAHALGALRGGEIEECQDVDLLFLSGATGLPELSPAAPEDLASQRASS